MIKIVQLKTIEQVKQTAFEEEMIYELEAVLSSIYTTKTGFTIIKITDGKDLFSLTLHNDKQLKSQGLEVGMGVHISFKKSLYDDELQGNLLEISKCESDYCSKLEQIFSKKQEGKKMKNAPSSKELLITTKNFELLQEDLFKAATVIRNAVVTKRPIIISHHADADGFSAGFLIEDALTSLIKNMHKDIRFLGDYLQRNPSRTPFYDIVDATKDVNFFMVKQERSRLSNPLLLILDNGSTSQDLLSIQKVKTFGFDVVVVDHHDPGELDKENESLICKETLAHVNPHLKGLGHGISASMLSYQLAAYIDNFNEPNAKLAAIGGVADKCEGEDIDFLIEKSGSNRDDLAELALYVDFEIFQTKFNHAKSTLKEFMTGSKELQSKIISLYKPLLEKYEEETTLTVNHYLEEEKVGKFALFSLNGETTKQRGMYYALRNLAAIVNKKHSEVIPRVVFIYTDSILVIRADPADLSFDVNVFIKQLQKDLPYAQVNGGGHNVAGSIKYVPAAKDEVLVKIKEYIQNL